VESSSTCILQSARRVCFSRCKRACVQTLQDWLSTINCRCTSAHSSYIYAHIYNHNTTAGLKRNPRATPESKLTSCSYRVQRSILGITMMVLALPPRHSMAHITNTTVETPCLMKEYDQHQHLHSPRPANRQDVQPVSVHELYQ
jgi:hypothetical protein